MASKRDIGRVVAQNQSGITIQSGNRQYRVPPAEVQLAGPPPIQVGSLVSFSTRRNGSNVDAINVLNTTTNVRLDVDYLPNGYFDNDTLRPEIIDTLAQDVAKVLGNHEMKANQMRRFFGELRRFESGLRTRSFPYVRTELLTLKPVVAYQAGRALVPNQFKYFIDRNVDLAYENEKNFRRGFIRHFQSVLAYFVYYFGGESE